MINQDADHNVILRDQQPQRPRRLISWTYVQNLPKNKESLNFIPICPMCLKHAPLRPQDPILVSYTDSGDILIAFHEECCSKINPNMIHQGLLFLRKQRQFHSKIYREIGQIRPSPQEIKDVYKTRDASSFIPKTIAQKDLCRGRDVRTLILKIGRK